MNTLLQYAAETLLLLLLAITFLQSGIDKLTDWNGNLSWLKGHFIETPFKNLVPLLLAVITVTENAAGALCLAGIVQLLISGTITLAFYGAVLSCLALLMLLLGQRLARDYEGARTLVVYFIPAVFLVYLLQA